MKPTCTMMKSLLVGSSLLALLSPVDAQDVSISVVSDKTWTVMDSKGNFLGNAQQVCLATNSPSNCPGPANATLFNPGSSPLIWASIPGANWIWAPGITGATLNADNAEFFFQTQFVLCGDPQPGTISIAADNSAEVFLNGGTAVATTCSETTPSTCGTSTDWAVVTTATVPASKFRSSPNVNTILIHAKNAPSGCTPDTYQCNPAGVVFGATFADALSTWPTCTGNQTNPNDIGQIFKNGQTQAVACPPGQVGSQSQLCGCINLAGQILGAWGPTQGSCSTKAPTCTDNSGGSVPLQGTQWLPCPQGQVGTSSCPTVPGVAGTGPGGTNCAKETCVATGGGTNASWSQPDTSFCQPPPVQCLDPTPPAGQPSTFNVGATEIGLPCPAPTTVGSASRTCKPNPAGGTVGVWGALNVSGCTLPTASQGGVCLDPSTNFVANCPSGTSCKQRCSGDNHCHDFWCCATCWLTGCCKNRHCTSQSFCDP